MIYGWAKYTNIVLLVMNGKGLMESGENPNHNPYRYAGMAHTLKTNRGITL